MELQHDRQHEASGIEALELRQLCHIHPDFADVAAQVALLYCICLPIRLVTVPLEIEILSELVPQDCRIAEAQIKYSQFCSSFDCEHLNID